VSTRADEIPEAASGVQKFTALTGELHEFLVDRGVREDEALLHVRRVTEEMGSVSVMQIAPEQGALMTLLARAIGAKQAVEVGTFTGYSAICIARGLEQGGTLVACELSDDYAALARRHFDLAGVSDRIDLRRGPAIETLRSLPLEPAFDFAFIDADKVSYPDYYEECLLRVRPGGLIALDNLLLGGRVLSPAADDEAATTMRLLADQLHEDSRVDIAMVGIADGIALARKR